MSEAPTPSSPRSEPRGVSMIEVAALVLTMLWLAVVGWFFLTIDPSEGAAARADPLSFMMAVLGIFLPVALIWVAASAARTARTMREESARLQAAIDAMRMSYVESQENAGSSLRRAVEDKIAGVARTQAVLGAEIAGLQAARGDGPEQVLEAPARPAPPEDQPALGFDEADPAEPLPPDDFIRALNFPDNERDAEGFEVLRRALAHHPTAKLVTAAQDVLTLLAQDGIYVDDLSPHRPPPAAWRRLAEGGRGSEIAALGGVRDRSSLALASGRMREDPVFRDAAHLFVRTFDQAFPGFADRATDAEISRFAETRTARAFMLLGKVAGAFDG